MRYCDEEKKLLNLVHGIEDPALTGGRNPYYHHQDAPSRSIALDEDMYIVFSTLSNRK